MKNKKNKPFNSTKIVQQTKPSGFKHGIFNAIQKEKIDFLFLFLAASCFLGFGIYHLGRFFITDEIVWLYKRYPMYWISFLDGGWGRFENFGAQSGILQILLSPWVFFAENIQTYHYSNFETLLFKWRLPLLIFNYLLLFVIFDRVCRLWGSRMAATAIVFIAFFPYLVGVSQIFNKDTTLWTTAIISILNFFLYQKTKQYRFAVYAGVFFGLALLSKFPASILFPVYFTFIYLEYLLYDPERASFLHALKAYTLCIAISMFIVFIALPPSWENFRLLLHWTWYSQVIKGYTNYILIAIALLSVEILVFNGAISRKIYNYRYLKEWMPKVFFGGFLLCLCFMTIVQLFDLEDYFEFLNRSTGAGVLIQTFSRAFFGGFLNVVKGSPLIQLLGVFGFLGLMMKKGRGDAQSRFFFYSMVLVMVYYAGAALAGAEFSLRYQIILLPLFCFFAAYFYVAILKKRFYLYLTLFFAVLLAEMVHIAPFYISYNNPTDFYSFLHPGVSWGQGGYEVAQSANHLPNAEQLEVLCDYEGFRIFFRGKGYRYTLRRKLTNGYLRQYDYLCLSSNGYRQITAHNSMTQEIKKYYDQPLKNAISFIGNGKSYVKLVSVE